MKQRNSNSKPFFDKSMSLEDKARAIILAKRMENYQEDLRRARVYLLMDLFYRGYQNVGPWDSVQGWPVYDSEALDYQENRFRRNVLINAGNMIRMEPVPVVRPASGQQSDLEAAITAQDAWEKAQDEISHDQLLSDKTLHKLLFGNTFIYSGYRFGNTEKIMVPKWKTETVEIPGAAICPGCGVTAPEGTGYCPECAMPMTDYPAMAMEEQVQNGFDTRERGQLFSTAFSPLEIKIRSRVKGGLQHAPFLLRVFRQDTETLSFVYDIDLPMSGSSSASAPGSEAMTRYQSMLGGLPGNPWGQSSPYWTTSTDYGEVDVVMGWIRPQCYRGDEELLEFAPDGLMATIIGSEVPELRPERIDDVWTHEVLYPNPHSAYGDGMFDSVPIQRGINTVNNLIVRHLEYDTIPLRLYDSSMINEKDFTNDPAQKWVQVSTQMEKGLEAAVRDLPAQNLSWDVPAFKESMYRADQDVSGATDPMAGQISGANTPYSAQILAVEQGQMRFLPSAKFNKSAVRDHVRQILNLAKVNWVDPRTLAEIDQNTGKVSWKEFVGADIGRGNWTIYISDSDFKPRTRGEQMQALDLARQYGVDVMGSPKLRLQFFEKIGLTPDGDLLSTQARRASRMIDKMRNGEVVTPNPLIDDGMIQAAVIQEYLASPQGDTLAEENPQAFSNIFMYLTTMLTMAAMKQAAMAGMGLPPMDQQPPGPAKPQQGGGSSSPKPETAQSPVPKDKQQPQPLSPGRQQQAAGAIQ